MFLHIDGDWKAFGTRLGAATLYYLINIYYLWCELTVISSSRPIQSMFGSSKVGFQGLDAGTTFP